ncbi:hypothetical protein BGZ57DRAFT_341986 [Hyaloscypha finlandica]|nr:hypothetical protein BGZ57DRAFT_341986 [Hyaloscypha finlandica]
MFSKMFYQTGLLFSFASWTESLLPTPPLAGRFSSGGIALQYLHLHQEATAGKAAALYIAKNRPVVLHNRNRRNRRPFPQSISTFLWPPFKPSSPPPAGSVSASRPKRQSTVYAHILNLFDVTPAS